MVGQRQVETVGLTGANTREGQRYVLVLFEGHLEPLGRKLGGHQPDVHYHGHRERAVVEIEERLWVPDGQREWVPAPGVELRLVDEEEHRFLAPSLPCTWPVFSLKAIGFMSHLGM